jgi:hypothetical protein
MTRLVSESGELEVWRQRARASILDLNDGIVTAAGIAEGFASAGATTSTLLVAGVATVIAGGFTAASARYTEITTEWEMNRALIEEERASIQTNPEEEFEELVGIYQGKGLGAELARLVASALTEHDPLAAHTDAEYGLDELGPTSGAAPAAAVAGLSYGVGAGLPLIAIRWPARSADHPDVCRRPSCPGPNRLVRVVADPAASPENGSPQSDSGCCHDGSEPAHRAGDTCLGKLITARP